MPRIRTIKPEALQHRKVGRLSDRAFRLWVGLLTQADDHGRLLLDYTQLRVLVWGYHLKVTVADVQRAMADLTSAGLVHVWRAENGQEYAAFPSWRDHQYVQRPSPSSIPEPPPPFMNDHEPSGALMNVPVGSDRIGSDRNGSEAAATQQQGLPPPRDWASASWPSPEALAHLYNTLTPDNVPAVESLSPKRRKRAAEILRTFPDRAWWEEAFQEYARSAFLSGRTPPREGHQSFKPNFDWLLATGRHDGTENVVKVHDGNYRH